MSAVTSLIRVCREFGFAIYPTKAMRFSSLLFVSSGDGYPDSEDQARTLALLGNAVRRSTERSAPAHWDSGGRGGWGYGYSRSGSKWQGEAGWEEEAPEGSHQGAPSV